MRLGFIIVSLDDTRKVLKYAARSALRRVGFEEIDGIEFVDGRRLDELDRHVEASRFRITGRAFHRGEVGLWLSTINCLDFIASSDDYDYVMVCEDDMVITDQFEEALPEVMSEIPDDVDFFSWAIPSNQKADYYYKRKFNSTGGWSLTSETRHGYTESPHYIDGNKYVCKAYQGYRTVSTMYTKSGANKILRILSRKGIHAPVDLMIFQEHHMGNLNGYTLLPNINTLITHKETGTIARSTGMYN